MTEIDVYVRNGFKLFPIKANSKKPACRWREADYAPDKIEECLLNGMNYGAVIPDDVVVIDVDKHGENGFNTFSLVSHEFNSTLKVLTASGGLHVFYRVRNKYNRTVSLYPGIDLLTNGYVVGAISNIDGKEYQMINADDIAYANDAVLDFIKAAEIGRKEQKKETVQTVTAQSEVISQSQRNDTLFRLACKLRDLNIEDLSLSPKSITNMTQVVNDEQCSPPLERTEIISVVSSALSYKKDDPDEESIFDDIITMDQVEPKEMEWLIKDLIPKNCTTLIGADGGTGKSYFWMSLFASLSAGKPYFFSDECPDPQKVLFFSSEDQHETVIVPRLLKMGANMKNIITLSEESEKFSDVTFNSKTLENLIRKLRPSVVCFDPIQSFVGNDINMGAQNQMRNMLQPLKRLEKLYDVTFIIVCHTNKRNSFSPRDRLSNSGDIWDIARSVIMMGRDLDNHIFVSREKGNYSQNGHYAFLYDIVNGVPQFYADSDKRFYDFMYEQANHKPLKEGGDAKESKLDVAERLIIRYLSEDTFTKSAVSEVLERHITKDCGVSGATFDRAITKLKAKGLIRREKRPDHWYTCLVKTDAAGDEEDVETVDFLQDTHKNEQEHQKPCV